MKIAARRVARAVLVGSFGLAVLTRTGAGLAAPPTPTPEDRTTARELALEGHKALKAGDYALAVDRFTRADRLIHAPTLLVDLGRSYIGLGRLVLAHETFQQVLREGVAPDAPAPWHKALQVARDEDAALKPRLAWVTIRVEGAVGAQITLDGERLPPASLGVRRAVDPGTRSVVASAEGYFDTHATLDLGEGQARELVLTMKRDPSYVPPKNPEEARPKPVVVVQAPPTRPLTPAFVAYGVGAAGLLLGTVSSVLMFNARADINADPDCRDDRRCSSTVPNVNSNVSNYRTFGTLAAVGFGVGIAGAGVGTYFLLSRPEKPRAQRGTTLSAQLAPGYLSLRGTF